MREAFEKLKKAGLNPEWYEEEDETIIVLFGGVEFLISKTASGRDFSVRRMEPCEETEYYVVSPGRLISFLKREE